MTTGNQPRARATYSLIIGEANYANNAANKGDSLTELWSVRTLKNQIAELERAVVAAARKDGRPWSEIGEALGMTKQAAQQKFAHKKPAKDDLQPVYDAALPIGEPGAWIREAIESLSD